MIQPLDLEVLKNTQPKPVPWIVPGILASGAVTLLYGPPGCGKSILMMAIAKAITEGDEVIGVQTQKQRVLSLDAENGEDEIHRRVHALGFEIGYIPSVVTDFSLEINVSNLEEAIAGAGFPAVLILDSLRTLWPEGDENSSESVTRLLTALQSYARKCDLAVLIIHHPNKSGGFRGSGALTAVPDIVLELNRKHRDKDESRRYLRWEKCRLGPARNQLWFAIQSNQFGEVQILNSHAPVYNSDPDLSELWPE